MNLPVRIMIADDSAHAREAVRDILSEDGSFEIIAEASSGAEALALTEELMPDVLLMDIRMPDMNGLEATGLIKMRFPYVKIVIITVSDDVTHLFEALKRGAQGYLLKNLSPSTWLEYLQAIVREDAPLSRELAYRILQEFPTSPKGNEAAHGLTAREREILNWVASGKTNREIGEGLFISEQTVKNHLKNILHKLQLENRVQLTRYAIEQGLVERDPGTSR